MASKIRKGDLVEVIGGEGSRRKGQAGHRGRVLEVDAVAGKVMVEGYNVQLKHRRQVRNKAGQVEGGITEQNGFIPMARVAVIDPKTDRPTRVGFQVDEKSGKKVRVARTKGTGTVLD